MAISPNQVNLIAELVELVRSNYMLELESKIDDCLRDPYKARGYLKQLPQGRVFEIIVPGGVSEEEKVWLKNRYTLAGWTSVEVFVDYLSGSVNHPHTFIRLYI